MRGILRAYMKLLYGTTVSIKSRKGDTENTTVRDLLRRNRAVVVLRKKDGRRFAY